MTAPKLRFKEFDGDWTLASLNQLSSKIGDGIHATPKYDENGTIPFINGNNLVNGQIIINGNTKRINTEEFQKYNQILSDQTLFLSINGTIGNLAFYKNEQILLGKSVCFINLKNDIDKKFIYLLLQSPQLTKTFNSELTGTTIKNLSLATVRNSEFYYPREKEQTKIATFLSAVDEKISQLTQKHQLLSQYKQGMMQKLFSQQIRFKADDGSEFEGWEEKQLGDVCHFINGRAYKQTEWEKEGTPVIRLQNLTGSGKEYYYSTLNLPDHQYCYNNDLLYMWSATFGPIFWQGEKAIFHYHIWKVEVKPQQLDKQYMYYLLDEMTEKMKSSLNGSTMLHVTKQGMESTKKNLPSIEEQTKIANFLSAIDQKIEVTAQQIEQAKQWKKGLLQQMFV